LKALQRMRIDDDGKVLWLRSQVQGCCAKVFSAVGVLRGPSRTGRLPMLLLCLELT
jgi:hypothetical protein